MILYFFYARCYFFIFQFPYVFIRISAVNKFFCRRSLVWFLKRSINTVSAIPKYFLSVLLGVDTTAFYTGFSVKHLLSKGHSALFLKLNPWLLEVAWIIIWLWEQWLTLSLNSNYSSTLSYFTKYFRHFLMFQEMSVD